MKEIPAKPESYEEKILADKKFNLDIYVKQNKQIRRANTITFRKFKELQNFQMLFRPLGLRVIEEIRSLAA